MGEKASGRLSFELVLNEYYLQAKIREFVKMDDKQYWE